MNTFLAEINCCLSTEAQAEIAQAAEDTVKFLANGGKASIERSDSHKAMQAKLRSVWAEIETSEIASGSINS